MDKYRVKYWNEDGAEGYVGFDSLVLAEAFYSSLDDLAEIQQYNEDSQTYGAVVYQESVD